MCYKIAKDGFLSVRARTLDITFDLGTILLSRKHITFALLFL